MSAPLFSIGGIASGLPSDMVDQLIAVERQPVSRMQAQQSTLERQKSAWSEVTTRLSAMRSAIDDVRRPGAFDAFTSVTSSDEDVVVATRTGPAAPQSMSFQVTQLAATHRVSIDTQFTSLDETLDNREVRIDDATGARVYDSGTNAPGTLRELIDDINAADIGVTASAVQVKAGEYQLVLTSTTSGADGAFSASDSRFRNASGNNVNFKVVDQGADAILQMGSDPNTAITISRSSNTISDLIAGTSLQLKSLGEVTVTTSEDTDAAVKAVKSVVDEVNKTIDKLESLRAYDAESGRAGALSGNSTLRTLVDDIRRVFSGTVAGLAGEYTRASQVGIESTREGRFELDEAALREALEADVDAVANLFARRGEAADPNVVTSAVATSATAPGTYSVTVRTPSTVASITGAVAVPVPPDQHRYTITTESGESVTVTLGPNTSVADAVAQINQALKDASPAMDGDLVATESAEGDAIVLSQRTEGLDHGFSVTAEANDAGDVKDEWRLASGLRYGGATVDVTDAAGATESFASSGRSASVAAGTGEGMVLSIRATGTTDVTVTDGIGGALDRLLSTYEGIDGRIANATDSLDSRVRILDDRIESFESRLEIREASLRRQFSALERMLGDMQSMGNWLAGQLGSLTGQQQS